MKIEIIKDCQFSGISVKAGQFATVQEHIGKQLVDEGSAISKDYKTTREKFAESVSATDAYEILEELPDHAGKLVKEIKYIVNLTVLHLLAEDHRSTVQKAANKRIEELS